jgi:hypothetical protein
MRLIPTFAAVAALATGLTINTAVTADDAAGEQHAAEAKALIKQFATTLQGELQAAIKAGGPINAVEVCKDKAPAIAADLSEQSGWQVGRTSLKTRNAALNTPDQWEQAVLEQFEQRKQQGEAADAIAYAEVVEDADGKAFRFMKAIPTGEVCLACHGTDIEPDLADTLDAAYPDDQARGFALGDIRGAFTLSKPL